MIQYRYSIDTAYIELHIYIVLFLGSLLKGFGIEVKKIYLGRGVLGGNLKSLLGNGDVTNCNDNMDKGQRRACKGFSLLSDKLYHANLPRGHDGVIKLKQITHTHSRAKPKGYKHGSWEK